MKKAIEVINNQVYIDNIKLRCICKDGERLVFTNYNIVVKISNPECDWRDQNINEWMLWKRLDKKDKKYFVPILEYKANQYLTQPYVRFMAGKKPYWMWNDIIEPLCYKYELMDLYYDIPNNWSRTLENQPIIYDYGV